jgi:phosphopantetheinyl transferase
MYLMPPTFLAREGVMNPESSASAALTVIDLDLLRPLIEGLDASLSREERHRASRFHDPVHADRFRTRRGVLRAVLGHHLERPPEAIRYVLGPHGKPSIPSSLALRFNASSSGPLFALAVSSEVEVGVDVERLRPVAEWRAIARRLFGPDRLARLDALPEADRTAGFLREWTAAEAVGKLEGIGLLGADEGGQRPATGGSPTPRPPGESSPVATIRPFAVGAHAVVALATWASLAGVTSLALPEEMAFAQRPWVALAP